MKYTEIDGRERLPKMTANNYFFKDAEPRILSMLPIYGDTIWQFIPAYPLDTSIHRMAGVAPNDFNLFPLAKKSVCYMNIKNIGHSELDHKISFQIDNTDSISGIPTYNYFDGARITYNWDWVTTVKFGIQYCPPNKFDDR